MVGVGSTPTSITSQPAARSPHWTACCSIGPVARVSRPTTTRPPPAWVPKVCAKARASCGVRKGPTTPRMPETPIFRRCSRGILADLIHQFLKEHARRDAAMFADHTHDGLGLADADVKPFRRPIDPQTVDRIGAAIRQTTFQM